MKFDYTKQNKFVLDTQVWFASQDNNGITINAGKIVGYVGEDLDHYRVLSNEEEFELEEGQLFLSLKECLKEYNLIKFCEINLGGGVKVRDCAIATDIEEAIKTLKEKYPEATSIREVE